MSITTAKTEPAADEVRALVCQAQAGSEEAVNDIRSRFNPLLLSLLGRLDTGSLTVQEVTDLHEEAERKLLDAVYSYDTAQNDVTFGLYAQVCIHNALVSELRRINASHRVSVIPLDDPAVAGLASGDNPARRAADRDRYEQLVRTIRTELSEYENRIWWAYMAGSAVSEIAAAVGKPEKSVHNAIYRIRQKLRKCLSEPKE